MLDREVLGWLLLGFLALFVVGVWLIRVPGSREGNPLTFDRAVFASASAVSLTGLQQDTRSSAFVVDSHLMPLVFLALTLGSAWLTLVATGLPAVVLLGMRHGFKDVIRMAVWVVAGGTIVGAVPMMLSPSFRAGSTGVFAAGLDALLNAASAMANSGIVWNRLPRADTPLTQLVLLPLSVLGGLGLPLLLDLQDRLRGRTNELMTHSRIVLVLTASAYLLGTLLLLLTDQRLWDGLLATLTNDGAASASLRQIRSLAVQASTLAIDSRSAGFPFQPATVPNLPRAAQWILMLLMALGASPAGTAGGLKLTAAYLLGRAAVRGLRDKRFAIETELAFRWFAIYAALIAVGLTVMLWAAPQTPTDRMMFAVVSAVSSSGLSHDPLSFVQTPLLLVAALMAVGRILPILLLWRFAERVERVDVLPV